MGEPNNISDERHYSDRDLLGMAALMMRALRNGTMRSEDLHGNSTLEVIWRRAAPAGCDLAHDEATATTSPAP